jgi:hypothetical protein
MVVRIIILVVHPWNDGDVDIVGRSWNDYPFRTGIEVPGSGSTRAESPRGLNYDFCPDVTPKNGPGVLVGEEGDLAPSDHERRVPVFYWPEAAMNRVVAKKVGEFFEIGQVIDRDHTDVFAVG